MTLKVRFGHCFRGKLLFLFAQVTNTIKETSLKWFKDSKAATQAVYDQSSGVSTLTIPQVAALE